MTHSTKWKGRPRSGVAAEHLERLRSLYGRNKDTACQVKRNADPVTSEAKSQTGGMTSSTEQLRQICQLHCKSSESTIANGQVISKDKFWMLLSVDEKKDFHEMKRIFGKITLECAWETTAVIGNTRRTDSS